MNGASERQAPYRGWRFDHPDIDETRDAPGLGLGLTGAVRMVAGAESVRQALLLLVSTRPGERVMRPDYGCDLHRLAFAPNDDTTAGLAIFYVREAVERFEPRVTVLRVDAARHPDLPERLDVVLEYRIRALEQDDRLVVPLRLDGREG